VISRQRKERGIIQRKWRNNLTAYTLKNILLMEVKMIKILKCKRCEHEWASKQEHPLICPKCKSPYWDRKRRERKSE